MIPIFIWSLESLDLFFECLGMFIPYSLHFSAGGHFGGVSVLAIVNSAAVKVRVGKLHILMLIRSSSRAGIV